MRGGRRDASAMVNMKKLPLHLILGNAAGDGEAGGSVGIHG